MSKTSYIRKPNATRIVKWTYWRNGKWHDGEHVCFEKTDEGAIASCYKHILVTHMDNFHITEIVTKIS